MICSMTAIEILRNVTISEKRSAHSVDLHRPALDPVRARRAAEQIGAAQQHLPFPCQDDRGLPAAQDDLLVRGEDQALAVDTRVDGAAEWKVERGARLAQQPDADRARGRATLEQQRDLAPARIPSQDGGRARVQRLPGRSAVEVKLSV